jgi:hypothetical protein
MTLFKIPLLVNFLLKCTLVPVHFRISVSHTDQRAMSAFHPGFTAHYMSTLLMINVLVYYPGYSDLMCLKTHVHVL